jgi:hypothetical protein
MRYLRELDRWRWLLIPGGTGCLAGWILPLYGTPPGFWVDLVTNASFVLVLVGFVQVVRRRRRKPELGRDPRGVRIVHADGRVSECSLVRDPEDREGCAQWIAEPPEGIVFSLGEDQLQVDYLPANTAIELAVRRDGP